MGRRKDGVETKKRILEAACDVFSDKGYRQATIADICEKAEANIAAVNYHFGDKETLYVEAWRHSFETSLAAHPPDGGVSDDAPPEARLRGRILALLHRISDDRNPEFSILFTELANPTGLHRQAMRATIRPLRERMASLIWEIAGEGATDTQVRLCRMSIISQCMGLLLRKRMGVEPDLRDMSRPERLDALADHITRFSLAGMRAIAGHHEPAPTARPNARES